MSEPMRIDQAATEAARERHAQGQAVLDAIFSYDRDRPTSAKSSIFWRSLRLEHFRQAIWQGEVLRRGTSKSGTIKSGSFDAPNWR